MDLIVGMANAARYLGVDKSTVRRRIKSGNFPKPDHVTYNKRGTIKIWQPETLDTVKHSIHKNRKFVRHDYRGNEKQEIVRRPRL